MSQLTEDQMEILRHALGLDHGRSPYRDHFNAEPGTADCEICESLVELGLMAKLIPVDWIPGDVFRVTDKGRQIALEDCANA